MKTRVALGAFVWMMFITLMHVQINVGWGAVEAYLYERQELKVGFLPVT
jgi:hypothetical protein